MRYAAFLVAVCCGSTLFARGEDPPTTITLTINTIQGDATCLRHNGTFTLTAAPGGNGKGSTGGIWSYRWQDRAANPTTQWDVAIDANDNIVASAGSGQFAVGVWKAVGDTYTVASLDQITPKNVSTILIFKANP